MPRLARLLLPLAAFALGYAAGRGWWPVLRVRRTRFLKEVKPGMWRLDSCGQSPAWSASLALGPCAGVGLSTSLGTALAGAVRDWWRGARRAACRRD